MDEELKNTRHGDESPFETEDKTCVVEECTMYSTAHLNESLALAQYLDARVRVEVDGLVPIEVCDIASVCSLLNQDNCYLVAIWKDRDGYTARFLLDRNATADCRTGGWPVERTGIASSRTERLEADVHALLRELEAKDSYVLLKPAATHSSLPIVIRWVEREIRYGLSQGDFVFPISGMVNDGGGRQVILTFASHRSRFDIPAYEVLMHDEEGLRRARRRDN